MIKILAVAIVACGALSACAPETIAFDKPGATAEQTAQDAAACQYDIKSKKGMMTTDEVADYVTMCMQGKGYRRTQ